jgi:hypothetical protein
VLLHGLVAVIPMLCGPEPPEPDPWDDLGPVVVIERIDEADPETPLPVERPPDGVDEPIEEATDEPIEEATDEATDEARDEPTERPVRPDTGESTADDPADGQPPSDADDAETPDARDPGAVSLLDLRNQSQAGARPNIRPQLERTDGAGARAPRSREGAGLQAPGDGDFSPATARDGKPRSLTEAGFTRRRNGEMVFNGGAWIAKLLPDGRLKFRNRVGVPSAHPGMSEAVRASQGQELYQKQKKQLLAETFELRLSFAVSRAEEEIERKLGQLVRELLEIWGRTSQPAQQRRRLLFERWDECEEAMAVPLGEFEGSAGERLAQMRSKAGDKARAKIESFIARHLPRGEPDAFSDEELKQLNRKRRSRRRFAPYD